MLSSVRSFLAWTSTLLLLLTGFLALHSIGRYDVWSWTTADLDESVSSGGTLGVGRHHVALNIWIHQDEPGSYCTTLDHISFPSQSPPLRDGRFTSSFAGFTIAKGARVSPLRVSYFGMTIPFWAPLILFALLPVYALITAVRRRSPLRIGHRLMNAAALASFALAVFISISWIKSHHYDYAAVPDKMFWENNAYLLSSRGITYWYFFDESLRLQRPIWWRFPSGQSGSRLAATMDPAVPFLGFGRSKTTYFHQSLFSGITPPRPLTIVAIPYYALLILALIVPAIVLALRLRFLIERRRRGKGQCPQCGYDLRATPELCPECGFVPTPS